MPKGEKQEDAERTPESPLTKAISNGDADKSPDKTVEQESPFSVITKDMPPEVKASFEQSVTMLRSGPMQDPVRQKITSQHITDIIKQTGEENKRVFESQKHGRWMGFFVLALILAFVFALYLLFKDKPETVQPVLTHLIAFGGGIGGGMYLATKPR